MKTLPSTYLFSKYATYIHIVEKYCFSLLVCDEACHNLNKEYFKIYVTIMFQLVENNNCCVSFPGVIVITLRYSKWNGQTKPFSDQGLAFNYINTACNCTVTSHYTGKLKAKTKTCKNFVTVMNITGTLFGSLCNNEISIDAFPGSKLFLSFKHVNRTTTPDQIVSIFFQGAGTYLSLIHLTISLFLVVHAFLSRELYIDLFQEKSAY